MKASVKHVSSETRWFVLYLEAQGEGRRRNWRKEKEKVWLAERNVHRLPAFDTWSESSVFPFIPDGFLFSTNTYEAFSQEADKEAVSRQVDCVRGKGKRHQVIWAMVVNKYVNK